MTYKVHLDGYNLLPMLTGQGGDWPRKEFSTGTMTANWWPPATTAGSWCSRNSSPASFGCGWTPFVNLRVPLIFDLRMDPFERASTDANGYYEWMERMAQIVGVASQDYVGKMIVSFKEFPLVRSRLLQPGRGDAELDRSQPGEITTKIYWRRRTWVRRRQIIMPAKQN